MFGVRPHDRIHQQDAERNEGEIDGEDRNAVGISRCEERRNELTAHDQQKCVSGEIDGGELSHDAGGEQHDLSRSLLVLQQADSRDHDGANRVCEDAEQRQLKAAD